jgi:predicted nucleic acid-binding protein
VIVVDTNVIVSLYLPTELSLPAAQLQARDPHWVAPRLWRSELRSVLTLYLRKGMLTLDQALRIQGRAEDLLADREFDVPSVDVLQLAAASGCSAYDCEFVALARRLNARLVTADRQILKEFPAVAEPLAAA